MAFQQLMYAPCRVRERQTSQWSAVRPVEQSEHVQSWKQSNIDSISIFTHSLLLLPELVKPRMQLKEMLQRVTNELLESEIEKERREKEMLKIREREEEQKEKTLNEDMRTWRTQAVENETTCQNSDIFIYGLDATRIKLMVNDAISGLGVKGINTITINGREVEDITSERFLSILSEEHHRCNSPGRAIIILEEFTTSMFLNFKRSGFVNANRSKGKRIATICWSSRPTAQDDAIMREFSNRVYVPSSKEDIERIKTPVAISDMIVHKPDASAAAAAAQNPPRVSVETTVKQEKGKSAQVKDDPKPIDSGSTIDPVLGYRETSTHNKCPDYDSIRNPPVTTEPRSAPEPYTSGLGQTVLWTKKHSENVNLEVPPDADDAKVTTTQCGKVADCITEVFAFFCD